MGWESFCQRLAKWFALVSLSVSCLHGLQPTAAKAIERTAAAQKEKVPNLKKYLSYSLCLLGGLMLQCGCSDSSHTLKIKTLIDGADTLKIQGNTLWYEHEEWELPGKHGGRNEPTTINGRAWYPEWNGSTNVPLEGLTPAFQPQSPPNIKLTKLLGRGEVTIRELPTPENSRTLSIYFNDKDQGGSDWYEVVIKWK